MAIIDDRYVKCDRKHQKHYIINRKIPLDIQMQEQSSPQTQAQPEQPFPEFKTHRTIHIKHNNHIDNYHSNFAYNNQNKTVSNNTQNGILDYNEECFIVVQRIQKKIVKETWLVDRKYMQVFHHQQNEILRSDPIYGQMLSKYRSMRIDNKNNKKKDLLFFGRSESSSISIANKSISNKHLLLQKKPHPLKQTIPKTLLFLHLYKKSQTCPMISPQLHSLSKIPKYLISQIVGYLGKLYYRDQYYLQDMDSKNGSYILIGRQVCISQYVGHRFYVDKKGEIGFTGAAIVKAGLRSLRTMIDGILPNINTIDNPVFIYNRNHSLQQQKQCRQALLLQLTTPSQKHLYILYPQQCPYTLHKQSTTLTAYKHSQTNPHILSHRIGQIRYEQDNRIWRYVDMVKNQQNVCNKMYMKMIDSNKYQICEEKIVVRLGKDVEIVVDVGL